MRGRIGFAAALATVGALSLACGLGDKISEKAAETISQEVTEGIMEKAIEQGSGGNAQVELGVSGAVDLSAMPAWLRYPNATGKGKMTVSNQGPQGNGEMWILETADGIPAVKAWYQQSLSSWTQSAMFETGDGFMMGASDPGGNAQVTVTVAASAGQPTSITVLHATGQAQ